MNLRCNFFAKLMALIYRFCLPRHRNLNISIEKSADALNGFSQCKYIKFNESANDSVLIIKRDVYPLAASEDVYYRVKTVTKEGVSRAYPPVRLPALNSKKK